MNARDSKRDPNRRHFLQGVSLAVGAAALGSVAKLRASEECTVDKESWDDVTDVICVGSGAAACTAAITAKSLGAEVVVLEKMPLPGGTTGKSSSITWIPNNRLMREQGIEDKKEDCLRYMARYSYPQNYTRNNPTLGLTERNYRLLEAFYDNGSRMIDHMAEVDAIHYRLFKMWGVDKLEPDYAEHLPENKAPRGRGLEPAEGAGTSRQTGILATQMEAWLREHAVPVLTNHRVVEILKSGRRVVGVVADNGEKRVRIRARRGVVFGTGGYAHNTDLIGEHQTALYGACASSASTGDFIYLASNAGARMGPMHTAWRAEVLFEEVLQNRMVARCAFGLPGDSMIVVNKFGRRVVNEKRNYNDRTRVHFVYDPTREEYPNQLLFMVFDERSLDTFGGAVPFPKDRRQAPWLISGDSVGDLSNKIASRLAKLSEYSGGVALDPQFTKELHGSIKRFNEYAKAGRDLEFDRGLHTYDRDWHQVFSPMREGTQYPKNPLPNHTMHPFSDKGPYHAFILAAGALDTNGGPLINEMAQVLDGNNEPIPGLYGAGNCIASPSREGYYGGGGTIGLAMTFGFIAGQNVIKEPISD